MEARPAFRTSVLRASDIDCDCSSVDGWMDVIWSCMLAFYVHSILSLLLLHAAVMFLQSFITKLCNHIDTLHINQSYTQVSE